MPTRTLSIPGRPGFARSFTPLFALGGFLAPALLLQQTGDRAAVPVARGVVVRQERFGLSGVRVIDVDLSAPGVRVEVAGEGIARQQGRITGKARTLAGWLGATGAVAGVNGGFFGESFAGDRKEIVGLLKLAGRVRVAAPLYRSQRTGLRYARSAFGLTAEGRPRISWVSSRPGAPQELRAHREPEFAGGGMAWTARQAVACGPRLVRGSRIEVADRKERLVSPGALRRTFLGYGGRPGSSGRLVLCAADAMEFRDCAAFLMEYFRRRHGIPCSEGMALDGGGSTQAAWRQAGAIQASSDLATTVPTAILVYGK